VIVQVPLLQPTSFQYTKPITAPDIMPAINNLFWERKFCILAKVCKSNEKEVFQINRQRFLLKHHNSVNW